MFKGYFVEVLSLSIATFYMAGLVPSAFGQCSSDPDIRCYDLGTLGGPSSWAEQINDAGQVVGHSFAPNGEQYAFFWTRAGGMVDLRSLGGINSSSKGLNEAGQVLGQSITGDGVLHAFFWTQATGMLDLGTLGGRETRAYDINEAGQIVGYSFFATGEYHAFLWTQAGGMVDLGTLSGPNSWAEQINNTGQVLGYSHLTNHAFLWTQAGGMVDLGTLGGHLSQAYDMNEAGQVVGHSRTATGDYHAFFWTPAGGMVDIGTLGGTRSDVLQINEAGQVLGESGPADGEWHVFVWTQAGGMLDLGTLGGSVSRAIQINEAGHVLGGSATTATGGSHAFFWTHAGGMVDIGTLGGIHSWADHINETGQVVGTSLTAADESHAFLWTQASGILDLGTLGGSSSRALQINDSGQIMGLSETANGEHHAIVWDLPPFLDQSTLHFNATADGTHVTSAQTVRVDVKGTTTDTWTVTADQPWIQVSPASGAGNGSFRVSVDPMNLPLTSWEGTIRVSWSGAFDMTRIVRVYGTVFESGETRAPFGFFDTPVEGTTGVRGSVAVTGWALDDIEVMRVEIWRDSVPGEVTYTLPWRPQIKVGEADFVEGARPDVEHLYPNHPFSYRAGWGYMMLTYGLPNQGNGTYVLYAVAVDYEGNRVTFGTKTITCDNANAVAPFGTIDTPGQGGTVSGTYRNWGWVLTPQPYAIPVDGSTIQVYVDGSLLGTLNYGHSRPDIQWAFPGYQNTDTAVGYFDIDTTAYENGIHTIGWLAVDDGGRAEGIGSRFFVIENTGSSTPDRR